MPLNQASIRIYQGRLQEQVRVLYGRIQFCVRYKHILPERRQIRRQKDTVSLSAGFSEFSRLCQLLRDTLPGK